jgi:hypothetical protein
MDDTLHLGLKVSVFMTLLGVARVRRVLSLDGRSSTIRWAVAGT